MSFKKMDIKDLEMNPFTAIGNDWMLISAGNAEKVNTMTASWGGVGHLWNENVVTAYIRPQRYTKEFVDREDCFSLSFFDGKKKELGVLGTVSGRDTDKIKDVDFHVTFIDGVPTFDEAKLVFILEKLYADTIKEECFLNKDVDNKNYPDKDYHTIYIAKIKGVYVKA
ncbi:MAG: flavin reductase family protein [Erysipelotrichaceae bacterium]|nr:flavin reductase family protein [Erysipelotrichaceae bacterium]